MKDMLGQWNKGRYAFVHTVLYMYISLKSRRSIVTKVLVQRDNMYGDRLVFINLANDLKFASEKNLVTYRIGFRSAQADHPLRFALLEIKQQGVSTETTGNDGGYDLNIMNSFRIIEKILWQTRHQRHMTGR